MQHIGVDTTNLNVSGIGTISSVQVTNLNATGVSTIASLSVTGSTFDRFQLSISTVALELQQLMILSLLKQL